MKLSQLRNFAAVVDAGAIRQAAERLNLSQSSITKSIQQLEDELGVELLLRSARGVTPTEAGRALLARVKTIDAELRSARSDVEAVKGASVGEVRISASPSVAMGLVPRAVVAFRKLHPMVTFQVFEGVFPDVLPAVRTGEMDIAVCLVPDRARDEALTFVSLVKDHLVPAVRAGHPLLSQRKLMLRELSDYEWIVYRRSRTGLDVFEQTFASNRLATPKTTVECTSFAGVLALVENSDAITLVPSQIFRGGGAQSIAPVVLDSLMQPWQVAAISRPVHELSAVCRAFLAELRQIAAALGVPAATDRRPTRTVT